MFKTKAFWTMLKKLQNWKRGTSLSLSLNCFQEGIKTISVTASTLWLIQIWKWNNCVSINGKLKNYKIAQFWLVRYLICRWLQILPRMKLVWRSLVLCPTVGGETVAGYLGISDRWLGLSYHLTLLLSPKYLQKCGHRKKCPPGRAHCCSQRMKGPKGKELGGVFWTLW